MTEPDEHTRHPMAEALDLLAAAVSDCDEQVGRLADVLAEAVPAVALLRALRSERQRLAAVEASVEATVSRLLGKGDHEIAGLPVRVNQSSKTTWFDSRTLAWRVAEPLVLDRASGEAHLDPDRVAALLDRLFDTLQVDYFRTTKLRALGVDYDDLVKREPGRRTVQFPTPNGSS